MTLLFLDGGFYLLFILLKNDVGRISIRDGFQILDHHISISPFLMVINHVLVRGAALNTSSASPHFSRGLCFRSTPSLYIDTLSTHDNEYQAMQIYSCHHPRRTET